MKKRKYTTSMLNERRKARKVHKLYGKNLGMFRRKLKKDIRKSLCQHTDGYFYKGYRIIKRNKRINWRVPNINPPYESDKSIHTSPKGEMPVKVIFSETGP